MAIDRDAASAEAHAAMDRLDALVRAGASYTERRAAAEAYIQANYAWQMAAYGKIQRRLSANALLR